MVSIAPKPPAPFSQAELLRRRGDLRDAAFAAGVETVLAYGANRFGSSIGWLTTWPVTREAVAILDRGGPARLLVGFPNHVPQARRFLDEAVPGDETEPLDADLTTQTMRALARGGPARPVGLLGPVPSALRDAVRSWATRVVALDTAYTRIRMTKSAEELAWIDYAAALTDQAGHALLEAAGQGATESEMVAAAEASYRRCGGVHHICYLSVTDMAAPDRCVPGQWPTDRRAVPGHALVFELSAGWGPDYPGQLLRTATVGAEPSPLYARLHTVAEAVRDQLLGLIRPGAHPADLMAVLDLVTEAGLTIVDDLVHGLCGGYLPPVLRGGRRPDGLHAEPLRPGMTLVVQPNICTPDLTAGVQTGELVAVTQTGWRRIHQFPAGLRQVPFSPSGVR